MAAPPPLPVALFFSQFLAGGTEGQMIELARRLDRRRFEVHLACLHCAGTWLPRAKQVDAAVVDFPIRSFRHPGTIHQMRAFSRWCRDRRIAVLHATDLYANVFALPAAAAARVPARIGNRREINPNKSLGLIALQRIGYRFAHKVAANSTAAAARLRQERLPAAKIVMIPNGVDLAAYPTRRRTNPPRSIITVATLRAEKAHEVLIEAAGTVLKACPDAEFRVVGGGSRIHELTALAARRGVGGRMHFLGHRDDVPALLAESDLFALTSRSEACPNSVIEAMAAGLPVVATNVGGIVELIEHQHTGVLVAPDDPGAVAAALIDLMHRPEYASSLGRAARQAIEARFSFDRMVSSFEELYLDLLQQRGAQSAQAAQMIPS